MNYINYLFKSIEIISLLFLFTFYPGNLFSQDNISSRNTRLLIYDFLTTDNYANIKDKKKNYQFYSIIIPETISKNLDNSGSYEISREKGPFSIGADFKDKEQRIKYLKKLEDLGSQFKSDYILTGTFNVINNRLIIRITIFNVKNKDIETVEDESSELGVQLSETPDQLTQNIIEKINNFNIINREKPAISPLITPPYSSDIITIGLDGGYLYFRGSFSDYYNNTPYLAPFIDFNLTDNLSLSLKYTSIQSDSDDKNTTAFLQARILSSSISICYLFSFTDNFGISLSAGGGVSKTTITVNPGKEPFIDSFSEKVSKNPNIDISSYFSYNLSSITCRSGVIYKRIFFQNKPIDAAIIFAGAGLNF